jgi:DNA-binding CsgD family transcriptional regulator
MTRRASRYLAGRATDREVGVVAAVLVAGSEKAAAHRLGLAHSTVKHHLANARSKAGVATTAQLMGILAPRLPEPENTAGGRVASARGQTAPNPDAPEDQFSAPSTCVYTR